MGVAGRTASGLGPFNTRKVECKQACCNESVLNTYGNVFSVFRNTQFELGLDGVYTCEDWVVSVLTKLILKLRIYIISSKELNSSFFFRWKTHNKS